MQTTSKRYDEICESINRQAMILAEHGKKPYILHMSRDVYKLILSSTVSSWPIYDPNGFVVFVTPAGNLEVKVADGENYWMVEDYLDFVAEKELLK